MFFKAKQSDILLLLLLVNHDTLFFL